MAFWMMFFVSLAFTVAGELIRPKQKFDTPTPSALGEIQFPTADSTRTIPVWWGTCKMQGPNTTWFGHLKTEAISKRVKTGWFSSTRVTQGFKYYLGVQLVFGYGPMDEMIDFRVDDKTVFGTAPPVTPIMGYPWLGSGFLGGAGTGATVPAGPISVTNFADYYAFTMNSPSLLGNDDPKNGVSGPVKVYKGTTTQPANAYLQAQWGEVETSAFRRLVHAVLEQCYLGNSDTPPTITLVGRRTPNPLELADDAHNINGDANAANMCYEILTDNIFGMKIPPGKIDVASFVTAGNTIATEQLGLSILIDTPTTGKALLTDILRHVDGVIYPDPQTGLYTMKLARADYDVETLPVFDESNIEPDSFEFSRVSWEDTINTTIVTYTDREADFTSQPVKYTDSANVYVRRGMIVSETLDFRGFSNKAPALRAAARSNRTRSSPLLRVQFDTNRAGWQLRPASVFKINMPSYGMVGLVMRVVEIDYGSLDEPAINVVCTEDVFAVNNLAYPGLPGTGWLPPDGTPADLLARKIVEVPYAMTLNERIWLMGYGVRGDQITQGFEVWSQRPGGTLRETGRAEATLASGTLRADYGQFTNATDSTGFILDNVVDPQLIVPGGAGAGADREAGNMLVQVDDEIMGYLTATTNGDGSVTLTGIIRGAFDTIPAAHAAGARVYFLNESIPLLDEGEPYQATQTVGAKLVPFSTSETFPIASVALINTAVQQRAAKPYPPGWVRINNLRNPTTTTGNAVLNAAIRDKVVIGGRVIAQDGSAQALPAGLTYTIRTYINNSVVATATGQTSTTFSYTAAARAAANSNGTLSTGIGIQAVQNGLTSPEIRITFQMTGFGMTFGNYFGGVQG